MKPIKKKFKVLKEGLGIDLYSLDETLWQQNLLIARLREENETLKDKIEFLTQCLDDRDKSIELMKESIAQCELENKKLKDEIKKLKDKVKEAYQKGLEQGYKDQ